MASIHEYISYEADNVGTPELFDTVMIRATIIQIDRVVNTADIYTDEAKYWGRVDNVPIFYHCEGKETVSFGHQAFKDGDEVIVLCKNARRKSFIPELFVVGFPDKPKICSVDMCYIVGDVISLVGALTDTDLRLYISDLNRVVQSVYVTQSDWAQWNTGDRVLAVNMDNCNCPSTCGESAEIYNTKESILTLHNTERVDNSVNPLEMNRLLVEAASDFAEEMKTGCFLSHFGTGGSSFADRIEATGYLDSVPAGGEYELGENVGLARSDEEVFAGWLGSPGHYANVIREGFHEIGIASADVSSCSSFYLYETDETVDLAATGEPWKVYVVTFGRKQPSPWTIIPIDILTGDAP